MFTKNEFMEIWYLQHDLNKMVGIDSIEINITGSHYQKLDWYQNFLDEAHNEAFEAKENIRHKWWIKEVKEDPSRRFEIIDEAKLKLELIDVLHFLVSACHVEYGHNWEVIYTTLEGSYFDAPETKNNKELYFGIGEMHRTLSSARMFLVLCACFDNLNMKSEEVLNIYKKKHAKNVLRQQNGYSQTTKTEEDNHEIEKEIRNDQV